MSDHDMNMTSSSSLDMVTVPAPPVYLFTMMGIWASLTGLLGITANILAIGVFCRVKRVFNYNSIRSAGANKMKCKKNILANLAGTLIPFNFGQNGQH